MKRYQIWGDNSGIYHGFKSYINGTIDNLKEAKQTFERYKRDYLSYHHLELHEVDFNGKKIKTLTAYKRRKKYSPKTEFQ